MELSVPALSMLIGPVPFYMDDIVGYLQTYHPVQ